MTQAVEAAAERVAPAAVPVAPRDEDAPAQVADGSKIWKQTAYLPDPVYEQLRRLLLFRVLEGCLTGIND
jgi:hypothetical protein